MKPFFQPRKTDNSPDTKPTINSWLANSLLRHGNTLLLLVAALAVVYCDPNDFYATNCTSIVPPT